MEEDNFDIRQGTHESIDDNTSSRVHSGINPPLNALTRVVALLSVFLKEAQRITTELAERLNEHFDAHLASRIDELRHLNQKTQEKCDKMENDNSSTAEDNREEYRRYQEIWQQSLGTEQEYEAINHAVACGQAELNRRALEVAHLDDGRNGLLESIGQLNRDLEPMLSRYEILDRSLEPIKSEATFPADRFNHLRQLLDRALEKKTAFDKDSSVNG